VLNGVLGVIPYTIHPEIQLGPLELKTFGLMTAIGVVLGIWYGAAYGEQYGLPRDEAYRVGTRMVVAGVIGARLTWVLTHLDQIDSPIDVIAVWEGGLQFSGGFIAAIAVGLPTFLRWNRLQRWQLLDGFAVAVLIGAAFGRVGCLAVGEHFGGESDFLLATRFDGGGIPRETTLGPDGPSLITPDGSPVVPHISFLNPALYECVTLFVLFGLLHLLLRRRPTPSIVGAAFLFTYAIQRFTWDSMRVNDERVAGMTGAQWMCLAMIPIGIYLLVWVRPRLAQAIADGEVGGLPVVETTTTTAGDGTTVTTKKRRTSAGAARPRHTTQAASADATDGAASDADEDDGSPTEGAEAESEADDTDVERT
jgi:phosphatidylglycerol:prolipoprotein diacylglycerol transferase